MSRELRQPAEQASFDQIQIPEPAQDSPLPSIRLGNTNYPSHFFANPASRLTPSSLEFPCVYLGADKETAIAEVWGDRFWLAREKNRGQFNIDRALVAHTFFLTAIIFPALRLCDLTRSDVLLALGLDNGSLYSTDLKCPQSWAERIARHPSSFDGILYPSRMTHARCLVLWKRPGGRDLASEVFFAQTDPFVDSPEVVSTAAKCQVQVSFVSGAKPAPTA